MNDKYYNNRIHKARRNAYLLDIDKYSKIVLMSDHHRSDGSNADNFKQNRNHFHAALNHYYNEGFTYIELGDGDELWETRDFGDILSAHEKTFLMLKRFYDKNRLFAVYGNHDAVKKAKNWSRKNLATTEKNCYKEPTELMPNLKFHESIILRERGGNNILLLHGHQADFFNDKLWCFSRFLVRYLWRPLELLGVTNPSSASKSINHKNSVENVLKNYSNKYNEIIIAGHTHRTVFPCNGEHKYFNDGCIVHPYGITAIEIEKGLITLVKWEVNVNLRDRLFISREVLSGPEKLF